MAEQDVLDAIAAVDAKVDALAVDVAVMQADIISLILDVANNASAISASETVVTGAITTSEGNVTDAVSASETVVTGAITDSNAVLVPALSDTTSSVSTLSDTITNSLVGALGDLEEAIDEAKLTNDTLKSCLCG